MAPQTSTPMVRFKISTHRARIDLFMVFTTMMTASNLRPSLSARTTRINLVTFTIRSCSTSGVPPPEKASMIQLMYEGRMAKRSMTLGQWSAKVSIRWGPDGDLKVSSLVIQSMSSSSFVSSTLVKAEVMKRSTYSTVKRTMQKVSTRSKMTKGAGSHDGHDGGSWNTGIVERTKLPADTKMTTKTKREVSQPSRLLWGSSSVR
mmetsp:Transcript_74365/g.209663  ORF Transcript_74365/g.209663 Transcript_74365/m.209663 type:complete len:204 (-) Transcript_74365:456-1067(-)